MLKMPAASADLFGPKKVADSRPLRDYQTTAINRVFAALRASKRRVVLQIPTAGGKTRTAAEIIRLGLAKYAGKFPCIFTVPRIQLIDQTIEDFEAEEIFDIGVIQGDHPRYAPDAMIQIACIPSLARRKKLPPAKLIIVDECHMRSEWLERKMQAEWADIPIIGLSATPWTAGMGKVWQALVIAATTAQLIESDPPYLSKFRLYAPTHPDLSGVKTVAGDYHEGQLSEMMQASGLVADAVQTWLAKGEGRPTLCFAVDCAHARKLCEAFNAAGVPAEYMDAYTSRVERHKVGARLRTGETKVCCNVGVATTGVNWPWVSCIVYARPTKSEALYIQIIGRALRLHPQGGDSIILDHTDTALRLGLPTEIHYESLDGGKADKAGKKRKKDKKRAEPKECPSCKALKPAGVHQCQSCGFAPARQSDLEFADGELTELRRGPEDRDGTPQAERQRWYSMLVHEATNRGYKPGWVYHQYAAKWGQPPGRDIDRGARPIVPDDACRNWIRSRQIAWAKGKKRAA